MSKSLPTAREAALKALVWVERDEAYLNLVFPSLAGGLSSRDRALALRIAQGTLQHLNTLDWALGLFLKQPLSRFTPWIRNLLRLSAYQLLYAQRIPPHAVIDEGVRLARRYGHRGVAGLANAVLRRLSENRESLPWPDPARDLTAYLALKYSHPPWLVRRWLDRYGAAETEALCRANNEVSPLSIRPNRLRVTVEELQERLEREGAGATPSPIVPGALYLSVNSPPDRLESYREGLFTIQGEGSMLVSLLLEPRPGAQVVDLCSAPGGKTTHLAELMEDRGEVAAVDIYPQRLRLVEKAAARLGLTCIRTVLGDGRHPAALPLSPSPYILVDAPCSGLGVLRRLPELKWRRRPEDLVAMQERQLELLRGAYSLLAPGGRLLYSVCTNEQEETEAVAQRFGRAFPDLVLVEESRLPGVAAGARPRGGTLELLPHRDGTDGFFMALWEKKGP